MNMELTVPLGQRPRSLNNGQFLRHGIQKLLSGYKKLQDVFGWGRYFGAGSSVAPTTAPESPAVNYGCKYF